MIELYNDDIYIYIYIYILIELNDESTLTMLNKIYVI